MGSEAPVTISNPLPRLSIPGKHSPTPQGN